MAARFRNNLTCEELVDWIQAKYTEKGRPKQGYKEVERYRLRQY